MITWVTRVTILWVCWLESFEMFIVARLSVATDGQKKALLIHSLGSEGQQIFRNLL